MFVVLYGPSEDTDRQGSALTPPERRADNKPRNKIYKAGAALELVSSFLGGVCAPEAF